MQLNNTIGIISGKVRITPTDWFPILSNISTPNLRRKQSLYKEYNKIFLNQELPIHSDIADLNIDRLCSRKLPLSSNILDNTDDNAEFNLHDAWMKNATP